MNHFLRNEVDYKTLKRVDSEILVGVLAKSRAHMKPATAEWPTKGL